MNVLTGTTTLCLQAVFGNISDALGNGVNGNMVNGALGVESEAWQTGSLALLYYDLFLKLLLLLLFFFAICKHCKLGRTREAFSLFPDLKFKRVQEKKKRKREVSASNWIKRLSIVQSARSEDAALRCQLG